MRRIIGIIVLLVVVSIIPLMDFVECAPPVVTINEPREDQFFPPGNVSFNWSAQFDQTELDHFEIRINDGNWTDVGINSTFDITDPVSGNNTVTVRAYDNETFGEATISFFIDDAAPVIDIAFPVNGSLMNNTSVNITWTIIEEASGIQMVRIKMDEGPWMSVSDIDFKVFPMVPDGDHEILIEAEDNVGNSGKSSIDLTVDTIPPSVIDFGPFGTNVERDEFIFIGQGEDIDPESVNFTISPMIEGNLTVTEDRIEFIPLDPLEPGVEYSVVVNFSDPAGNRVDFYEWSFTIADHYLEGKVLGYVVDSYGEYVQGALVTIGNITTFTNTFGSFDIEVMPGHHSILIEKDGYTAYEGNLTLLPTREMDLGKLVLEGGISPLEEDDEDVPWLPIIIIIVVIGGLAAAIIAIKNKGSSKDQDIEE